MIHPMFTHLILVVVIVRQHITATPRHMAEYLALSIKNSSSKYGCYGVDVHIAGADCGFGGQHELTVDWCRGKQSKGLIDHSQTGWTTLGDLPFYTDQPGRIRQSSGAVDAYRVRWVGGSCTDSNFNFRNNEVYGLASIHLDADFEQLDASAFLAEARRQLPFADVLSASKGSVVVDMELHKSETPVDFMTSVAQTLCDAANGNPGCVSTAALTLHTTEIMAETSAQDGERVVEVGNPDAAVSAQSGSSMTTMKLQQVPYEEETYDSGSAGILVFFGIMGAVVVMLAVVVIAQNVSKYCATPNQAAKEVNVSALEAGEEKPSAGTVVEEAKPVSEEFKNFDDNASTATPKSSLCCSLGEDEDTRSVVSIVSIPREQATVEV